MSLALFVSYAFVAIFIAIIGVLFCLGCQCSIPLRKIMLWIFSARCCQCPHRTEREEERQVLLVQRHLLFEPCICRLVLRDRMGLLIAALMLAGRGANVARLDLGLEEHGCFLVALVQPEAAQRAAQYPHQLSGGMRQRAMIAMALCCEPKILIADEPTTALDVTIQAQVLELIRKLRDELSTAILLITHDLGVIAENADRVIVMYAGKKIEEASIAELFNDPLHPYTKGLLNSVPSFDNKLGNKNQSQTRLEEIPGIVPPLTNKPRGCSFAPRCSLSTEKCRESAPSLKQKGQDHTVACWAV